MTTPLLGVGVVWRNLSDGWRGAALIVLLALEALASARLLDLLAPSA
jgi:hypothetical protein